MADFLSFPLFACIDLTYNCNLNCLHCCFGNEVLKDRELTTNEIKEVLNEFDQKKLISLQFAGGEPFVRGDIFEIIEYAATQKFKTSIATNGMFIDSDIARFLYKNGIRDIQISLDGYTKIEHEYIRGANTFEQVIEAINCLNKNNIDVTVASFLYPKNVNSITQMINFLKQIDVKNWRLQFLLKQGNAIKNFGDLYITPHEIKNCIDVIEKNSMVIDKEINVFLPCFAQFTNSIGNNLIEGMGCGAGTTSLNINPFGEVTPCGILTDTVYSMGNVRENNLSEIWLNSLNVRKWREITADKLKGKCKTCSDFTWCKGGCRASAVLGLNDFFESDPLCWK